MKTQDITVSRVVRGSASEVFDIWLDPKNPGGLWLGIEKAIITPVVDGLFYHVVKHEGQVVGALRPVHPARSRTRHRAHVGLRGDEGSASRSSPLTLESSRRRNGNHPAPRERARRRAGPEPRGRVELVIEYTRGAFRKGASPLSARDPLLIGARRLRLVPGVTRRRAERRKAPRPARFDNTVDSMGPSYVSVERDPRQRIPRSTRATLPSGVQRRNDDPASVSMMREQESVSGPTGGPPVKWSAAALASRETRHARARPAHETPPFP